MSEVITVEAVSNKPKFPKFNSGAVLVEGKWINVSSKLDISMFKKDNQVTVDIETNDKGYKTIVGIVEDVQDPRDEVEDVIKTTKPVRATKSKEADKPSYEDTKNRKILVQGVTQACIVCPALASLPGSTVEDIANEAKELALLMIEFVDSESSK